MQPVPQPLRIVAALFIVGGIFCVVDVVAHLTLNLGVLGIFIGYGLMRLNPRSLMWAMVSIWYGLIFLPIAAVLSLFIPGNLQFFGLTVGQAPYGFGFIFCVALFAITYWQYNVLKSNPIRQLFVSQTMP